MKYSFFDICDTLYYANTTFDFIQYVLLKYNDHRKINKFNRLKSKKGISGISGILMYKVLNIDIPKQRALMLLKGITISELNELSGDFYSNYLKPRKVEETFDLLKQAKTNGEKIILLSGSIEPVVKTIASQLNVDYFASTLYCKNNTFTGKIKEELKGKKHNKVAELLNTSNELKLVTDNFSDFKLAEQVDKVYAIVYTEEDKLKWKKLKPTFIKLGKQ